MKKKAQGKSEEKSQEKAQDKSSRGKLPSRSSAPSTELWREVWPGQSLELLKELHLVARDGSLQADSRRKLKQVLHLVQQIRSWIEESLCAPGETGSAGSQAGSRAKAAPLGAPPANGAGRWLDVGSGKSYLGFIIYDLFMRNRSQGEVWNLEVRPDLIERAKRLAEAEGFERMRWLSLEELLAQSEAKEKESLDGPEGVDVVGAEPHDLGTFPLVSGVMALHACDTATDQAIDLALRLSAKWVVLVPCCQAEVAAALPVRDPKLMIPELAPVEDFESLERSSVENQGTRAILQELWADPLARREFGAHLTDTLRILRLRAQGYRVRVTELVGLEHSLKNRLILAERIATDHPPSLMRLQALARLFGVQATEAVLGSPQFRPGSRTSV